MAYIDDEFVALYADKNPPWGFNGLGEIVYLRTYSRPLPEKGRNEVWPETIQRSINGAIEIGVPFDQSEAEALFDHMFNLRCSLSGRALWQMGTPLVQQFSGSSLNNCFAGETEIITRDGVRTLQELAGTETHVLTEKGWVLAPVRSFGVQATQKIVFRPASLGRNGMRASRSNLRHEVVATPNHRWLLLDDTETDNLKVGDVLKSQSNVGEEWDSAGYIHGNVFGDGTRANTRLDGTHVFRVRLCGEKRELAGVLEADGWKAIQPASNGDPIYTKATTENWKALPEKPTPQYACGFIAGWIATDGHMDPKGHVSLTSQDIEAESWLRKYAAMGDYLLVGACVGAEEVTNYGQRSNTLYRYTLTQDFRAWKVEEITALTEQEVFCATVPEVGAFTLASGIYTLNCYYVNIESIEGFEMLFDYLMLGGGVGYSVERAKIHEFPKIKEGIKITHERTDDADIIVPDKREGWRRILHSVLKSYFETGKSFTYSTLLVREYGAPLKTFGGQASGPGALIEGITDICGVLERRAGKKLRSIDVLDICNIIGRIVVSGSSRRSAQIAIGDPDDILFLRAKNWATGTIPPWRSSSNNSIYADRYDQIMDELWKGYDGSGEPYGLINRGLARTVGRLGEDKPDPTVEGFNPCAEIGLADGESCNLATIFLPNVETYAQLLEISTLLYKVQKQITRLEYPYARTSDVVKKNARLGQSITGVLQCNEEQLSWLAPLYTYLETYDKAYSRMYGFPPSVRLTTVQPSGTLSLLPGVTPGIHPAFAPYYIRRVRFAANDPLVDECRRKGYVVVPELRLDGSVDRTQLVVEFPAMSPEGATLTRDMTAIEQLEWVKRMQTDWADNAVSVTVYYRMHELDDIKTWLSENYDNSIKSVSFLLHSDHNFALAPYEEITKEEYHALVAGIDLEYQILPRVAGDMLDDASCATGACPVR